MPLVARTIAEQTLIPLGVPVMLIVLVLVLRRAANDVRLPAAGIPQPAS
jgi:alpha-1,2-mannosyltransferase